MVSPNLGLGNMNTIHKDENQQYWDQLENQIVALKNLKSLITSKARGSDKFIHGVYR